MQVMQYEFLHSCVFDFISCVGVVTLEGDAFTSGTSGTMNFLSDETEPVSSLMVLTWLTYRLFLFSRTEKKQNGD